MRWLRIFCGVLNVIQQREGPVSGAVRVSCVEFAKKLPCTTEVENILARLALWRGRQITGRSGGSRGLAEQEFSEGSIQGADHSTAPHRSHWSGRRTTEALGPDETGAVLLWRRQSLTSI